ncbi:alpha/beta hydrolase [Lentibacter algarum]|uniref:alpha/beta fold hydrolase n=1 Tax=Lentibacter algarum TaxID=576131 RepID=UPI001C09CE0F|nr:alpha/beta hydrolase [Lentibacter algarum]MBU2982489.1 alpha/beta hydrolase [Lentibacter algarum]
MKIGPNEIYLTDTGGDKPALLFVHGIMMDHSVWSHQVAEFSATHRVICVDLRGFGASTTTSPEISFEDHRDDLLTIVDGLNLRDVTLVGWSMGGAIAQVMAAENDGRIKQFVLVDTTPQLVASNEFPHALPGEAAQQLGGLLVEDFAQGCGAFCGMIAPEDETVAAKLTAIAAATDVGVAMSAFGSSGARNQLAELPLITTPTTVVCGRNDAICLPAASEVLATTIPGCSNAVLWIEDAGHAPFLTKPAEFNAVLRAVL